MGISYGKATDWLVSTLPTAASAAVSDVVVADGSTEKESNAYLMVGVTSDTNATASDGEQTITTMGAGRVDEDYDIPCLIIVNRPGPALKPARDDAIALFDVVASTVASDRTLGGSLLGGRYAQIEKVTFTQSFKNTDQPGALRSMWVEFVVHCQSHYQP